MPREKPWESLRPLSRYEPFTGRVLSTIYDTFYGHDYRRARSLDVFQGE